jgi:hypothetical protein
MIKHVYLISIIENFYYNSTYIKMLYNNQSIIIVVGILLFTGRWITLLSSGPSRERRWPRDGHVILCLTFEFLFEFQNRIFLEFFIWVSSCSNIKPFKVWGSTVHQNMLPRSRTDVRINSTVALSCCTTVPNPMRPTKFKTSWMPYRGRCWDILCTAWTHCHAILMSSDHLRKLPQATRSCWMIVCRRLWYSGLVSSPRNCLQMGYADRCSNGTNV